MEIIETQKPQSPLLNVVIDMDRSNYRFRNFRLLPDLAHFNPDPRWLAKMVDVKVETALEWIDILLSSGVWAKTRDGYSLQIKELNTVSTVSDFMTVNASIQARLSDDGPCWFEVETLATNEALYRQFLINMGKLMTDFKKQSQASKGDKVVSFGFNVLREAEQTVSTKGDA